MECYFALRVQTPFLFGAPCQQMDSPVLPDIDPSWSCGLDIAGAFTCPPGAPGLAHFLLVMHAGCSLPARCALPACRPPVSHAWRLQSAPCGRVEPCLDSQLPTILQCSRCTQARVVLCYELQGLPGSQGLPVLSACSVLWVQHLQPAFASWWQTSQGHARAVQRHSASRLFWHLHAGGTLAALVAASLGVLPMMHLPAPVTVLASATVIPNFPEIIAPDPWAAVSQGALPSAAPSSNLG